METPEGLGTRLSLLIDGEAHRTSSRLVFASCVSSLWRDRKRREALTVVALGVNLSGTCDFGRRAYDGYDCHDQVEIWPKTKKIGKGW